MASSDLQPESEKGFFLFEAPGLGLRIAMDFAVVDRIAAEALRGLAALPRRGMEVGGLLLGRVEASPGPPAVRIEGCIPFSSEHLFGPSFQLSPRDRQAFAELAAAWTPARNREQYAVGLYRSHTRGELELTPEDVELLDSFFLQSHAVCLLVQPFAMRPGEAAFFARTGGAFRPGPPQRTFPFRRKELGGGATPRGGAAAAPEAPPSPSPNPPPARPCPANQSQPLEAPGALETVLGDDAGADSPPAPRSHPGWLWFGALLVFLLAGVLIGVQIAGGFGRPAPRPVQTEPYSLGLSALQFGETIHFRWNPDAPALRACQSASLIIRDGDNTKIIGLARDDLARGTLIYRNITPDVQFRMEAILSPGSVLSESLHLRLLPPGEGSSGTPPPIR